MRKLFFTMLALAAGIQLFAQRDYVRYIDPVIGSLNDPGLSNGNLYPCIARPWGMNHWTPQTDVNGDKWQYSYTDSHIVAFKQTHQPSPWAGDYGMLSLMPTVGERVFLEEDRRSWFSHKTETVEPAYYSVYLADHDVTAEMSPTPRGCMMRFAFPEGRRSHVVIDAFAGKSFVKIIPRERKIVGYTTDSYGFGPERKPDNFRNYFVIRFDRPFASATLWRDGGFAEGDESENVSRGGAVVTFETKRDEPVTVRMATSFISPEQAERNLAREIGEKDFDRIRREGHDVWNNHLSRFAVEDDEAGDAVRLRTFYSALYRMLLYPRELHEYDADGKLVHYSPFNGKVLPGRMYTDNGFWDTFRAVHPFFNLFYPEFSRNFLEGLANTYRESGWLPEWVSPGHVDCMVGSNSASVVASAVILNGVKDNLDVLWEAVYKNAYHAHPTITSVGRAGIGLYDRLGYVPTDAGVKESAARTLEYAYDDYCVLRLAEYMNKDEKTRKVFADRSLNYKNLFHPTCGLMAGRDSKGGFRNDFDPFAWGGEFTEGNSWHYSWSVFHDPAGLMTLMGGRQRMVRMLDSVFRMPPVFDESFYGIVTHEIREMQVAGFGQYAHGNQPIQHMIYLYDWVGQPWKAQYWSRQAMRRLYRPTPDGYCGDEDNGQTSAWYVLSAMGFYPVCPVNGEYALGSPLFRKMTVTLADGKKLEINAPENSDRNVYIDRLTVDGRPYDRNYFTHAMLQRGGRLDFSMSDRPNRSRGTSDAARPSSFSDAPGRAAR